MLGARAGRALLPTAGPAPEIITLISICLEEQSAGDGDGVGGSSLPASAVQTGASFNCALAATSRPWRGSI